MALGLIQNVVVTNLKVNRQVLISWEAMPLAVSYYVYRSAIPYAAFTKIATVLSANTSYTDTVETLPIGEWYYYITAFDGSLEGEAPAVGQTYEDLLAWTEDPLTQTGHGYPTNSQMNYYFEEIRRRNLWLAQNDGEAMSLYKRRFEGDLCPHWDENLQQCSDPLNVANPCYGTGYIGGFYSSYSIKIRRIVAPAALTIAGVGYQLDMKPRMWTIWTPRLVAGDFLVTQENKRYMITNVHAHTVRGLILHQDFDVELRQPNDMIYKV